jgi:anti-sigma-K factor RskA
MVPRGNRRETESLRHTKATEQSQETAALYALGALTQQEARSFEFHLLEECPTCKTLVRHFEKVAAGLGYAAAKGEPAFYLRDVLVARIEREPQNPATVPVPRAEESFRKEAAEIALLASPPEASRRSSNLVPWVLAVFLAISAALFLYLWRTASRHANETVTYERNRSTAIRAEADRMEGLLKADQAKSREIDQINMALSSPDTKTFLLTSQTAQASAAVVLFWNRQTNRGVVLGQLPRAPAGKDYQLWLMVPPDTKVSEGLLEPESTGRCFSIVDIPPAYSGITAVAITIEPKGGSPQPTTRAFALSK